MLSRRGLTLAELLVALVLAAIVLGSATTSVLRQQLAHARIIAVSASDAQLRAFTLVSSGQLAHLDAAAGDLVAGEAADTALQFRAAVAIALSCAADIGAATFVPDVEGAVALGGSASLPRAGDSLWWLGDSSWKSGKIADVAAVTATCTDPVAATGASLRVVLVSADTIPSGAPLRVTRQTRFGVYRAGDGTWQLGFREWSETTQRFAAPQPIAGPLLPASGARRSGFRYFDDGGAELSPAYVLDVTRVARIRITAHSLVAVRERNQDSVRTDSIDVALRHAQGP